MKTRIFTILLALALVMPIAAFADHDHHRGHRGGERREHRGGPRHHGHDRGEHRGWHKPPKPPKHRPHHAPPRPHFVHHRPAPPPPPPPPRHHRHHRPPHHHHVVYYEPVHYYAPRPESVIGAVVGSLIGYGVQQLQQDPGYQRVSATVDRALAPVVTAIAAPYAYSRGYDYYYDDDYYDDGYYYGFNEFYARPHHHKKHHKHYYYYDDDDFDDDFDDDDDDDVVYLVAHRPAIYHRARYGTAYNRLVSLYGEPVSVSYGTDGDFATWYTPDRGYVTLSLQPQYGYFGAPTYHTDIIVS